MGKYIDKEKLLSKIYDKFESYTAYRIEPYMIYCFKKEDVELKCEVDAVEVVRCKDCKYAEQRSNSFNCYYWYAHIEPDNYCSYGIIKEDQ